ncbi:50S ribosomal protein L16 [Aeropyrum camini]|uniref:Large ribosomal subunit protein uL16 n=1 Tax=Aeropyrum camini SY1 = JCM 12091 TaxID=1198449 RepID=U3T8E2_9CREN|nr:50S ribosomal protein L16 [Aeropyrum camini]BAN89797.1 50S ribosomal protein L10 [Aeropyrum camini SY1 = JCM 12091]
MPLRPARCYTHFSGPPYTRREYIHGVPPPKITRFEMGNREMMEKWGIKGELVMLEAGQIRHNALEAARIAVNKYLATTIGDRNFYFRIRVYPHHVIRENKMMAFAGADRLQDGMRQAFGKPVGTAARVYPGTVVLEVWAREGDEDGVREALRRGASKFPLPSRIVIRKRGGEGS